MGITIRKAGIAVTAAVLAVTLNAGAASALSSSSSASPLFSLGSSSAQEQQASAPTDNQQSVFEAAREADEGEGAFATETLEHGQIRVALSGASFVENDNSVSVVSEEGEVIETLFPEVPLEGGQSLDAQYTVVSDSEVIVTLTSDDPDLQNRLMCWNRQVAAATLAGCLVGGIPTVGAGCPAGAIAGALAALGAIAGGSCD